MRNFSSILTLVIVGFISMITVVILYITSEKEMQRNNAFIRRYPHHPVLVKDTLNLKYNSYYFAGFANDTIYLGNKTAPLFVLRISLNTRDTSHFTLEIPDYDQFKFRKLRLHIRNRRYFLFDGSVPAIFTAPLYKPSTNRLTKKIYFDYLQPIDSVNFWIRSMLKGTQEMELGILSLQENDSVSFNTELLTKNIDGFFDADGKMMISDNRLLYMYFYRNEFLKIDLNGKNKSSQNTIDTLKQSEIEIVTNAKRKIKKLASRPILINRDATASNKLIYISSDRLGKYEPYEMLDQASIIDVYNYTENTYEYSFYLYDHFGSKAREFKINDMNLYSLHQNYLIIQKLDKHIKNFSNY